MRCGQAPFDHYRPGDGPHHSAGTLKPLHIDNLDTLRASAILLVVIYHSTQIFASELPWLWQITQAGFLGVDLFFALSGYLIGSLFFMEKNTTGRVDIRRFIFRRISRTVPPYLIALAASYLAVYLYRGEPFDLGYLVFAQNYYREIPFFLISWSLCVEEHFYLVLPGLLSRAILPVQAAANRLCADSVFFVADSACTANPLSGHRYQAIRFLPYRDSSEVRSADPGGDGCLPLDLLQACGPLPAEIQACHLCAQYPVAAVICPLARAMDVLPRRLSHRSQFCPFGCRIL